jgi:hypothetical protein
MTPPAAIAAPDSAAGPDRVATLRDIASRASRIESGTQAAHPGSVILMRLGRIGVAASPDGIGVCGPGIEETAAAGEPDPIHLTRRSRMIGAPAASSC